MGQSKLQQLLNPTTPQANAITDDANLVTTLQVARAVKAQQNLPYPPAALLGGVTASPATGSDFITISAQGSDPQLTASSPTGSRMPTSLLPARTLPGAPAPPSRRSKSNFKTRQEARPRPPQPGRQAIPRVPIQPSDRVLPMRWRASSPRL